MGIQLLFPPKTSPGCRWPLPKDFRPCSGSAARDWGAIAGCIGSGRAGESTFWHRPGCLPCRALLSLTLASLSDGACYPQAAPLMPDPARLTGVRAVFPAWREPIYRSPCPASDGRREMPLVYKRWLGCCGRGSSLREAEVPRAGLCPPRSTPPQPHLSVSRTLPVLAIS